MGIIMKLVIFAINFDLRVAIFMYTFALNTDNLQVLTEYFPDG